MSFIFGLTLLLFSFSTDSSEARDTLSTVIALRVNEAILVDGKLDETIWKNGQGISRFTQRDPIEGTEPTEKTIVHFAYDDDALYVAARMYDSSPDSIIARLARKDVDVDSDGLIIFIDPYYDRRSGYYFALNAAGTPYDGVLYNDNWDNSSWDGVWEGKVNIDSQGWTAEMRIPFSQVRFYEGEEIIWGVNVRRDIMRKNERDFLVYIPKNESGFVSHFADLRGITNIQPQGGFELLPYITTKAEYTNPDANDPFNKRSSYVPGLGADFKMGIGTNLTLNATINPDFGQVEIDPAVINLSDVETYFDEKRPFFVEGSTIFDFGYGGANNYWGFNWSGPNFFYSRRIGRVPQGNTPDADYKDYPDGTHILGAAKLSGKIEDWNIGVIQSLTSREYAKLDISGQRSEMEVEPLTYYSIIRGQKEINEGHQGLGFIGTASNRFFKDNRLRNDLNSNSYALGLDGWTFTDSSKTWVIAGYLGASHVIGNSERMISLQTNSQHYFQRPDAKKNRLDSSATSLTGYTGRFYFNKQKGNLFVNTAFGFITPGFDVNDLGILWRTDVLNMHFGGGYYWTDPTDIYRYFEFGGAVFRNYDFDYNVTWEGIFHFGYMEFLNYYGFSWNLAYNPETVNSNRTRGGPLTLNPPGYQISFSFNSDSRKDIIVGINFYTYRCPSYSYNWEAGTSFEIRPSSNVSFSINPFFSKNNEYAQWVNAFDDPTATATFGKRYLFAKMDQKTIGANIRLNWTFTPKLSLQLYAQPLISSGDYFNYKELVAPRTYSFNRYGEGLSTFDETNLIADPDGNGPAASIQIDNPDFNYKSLRGNAVLRWEYFPGSVLYFVWTQTRSDYEEQGEFQFKKSISRLWDAKPDNIFMVKFTYWFNM